MTALADLFVKIGADPAEYYKALDGMASKTAKFGNKLQSIGKSLSTYITLPLAGMGAVALKTSADFESVETALGVILKDGEKAKSLFREWQDFSSSTPLQLTDISKAGKSLLAFGIGAEDVTNKLRQIGDISSGIGAPIRDIAEIYGKARVQGRLFAEDINQLTGRGIPIIGELAKQFNVSESAIKGMVAEGKVGFPDIELAFQNMTSAGGQFHGMMDRQSKTLGGLYSTLKDNVVLGLREIGDQMVEAFNLKENMTKLIDWIKGLVTWFKNLSPEVKATALKVTALVAAAGPLLTGIGFLVTGIIPKLIVGLKVVTGLFALLTSPIGLIVAGIAALGYIVVKNFDKIKPYIVDVINYFIDLYNESTIVRIGVEAIKMTFKTMWEIGRFVLQSLGDLFSSLATIIKGVFTLDSDTITKGWQDLTKGIAENAMDMADNIKDSFQDSLDSIVSREPVALITEGDIDAGIENVKNRIDDFKNEIFGSITGGATGTGGSSSTPVQSGSGEGSAKKVTKINEELFKFLDLQDKIDNISIGLSSIDILGDTDSQIAELEGMKSAVDGLLTGLSPDNPLFDEALLTQEEFNNKLDELYTSRAESMANSNSRSLQLMQEYADGMTSILNQTVVDLAAGFGEWLGAFAIGKAGVADLGKFLLGTLAGLLEQLGKLAIKVGIGLIGIKKALQSLNPAEAIGAGIALIALAAVFKAGAADIGGQIGGDVPKLANGGVVFGRSLVEVGEYSNARTNPEVIAPLSKLKDMMPKQGGLGNIKFELVANTSIDMEKLEFTLEQVRIRKGEL